MEKLFEQARSVAAALTARRQTVAIAESSTGGLISAALLAVPGARPIISAAGLSTRRGRGTGCLT